MGEGEGEGEGAGTGSACENWRNDSARTMREEVVASFIVAIESASEKCRIGWMWWCSATVAAHLFMHGEES